jgi:hypothetical protein
MYLLCQQCIFCVSSVSFVSAVYLLCQKCVFCVSSVSFVSTVYPLYQKCIFCVRNVSFVSEMYILCQQCIFCVSVHLMIRNVLSRHGINLERQILDKLCRLSIFSDVPR